MRRSLFLAFLILIAGLIQPAVAQYARGNVRSGAVLPLDEILGIIRHSRAGSFYDADGPFAGPDGQPHYRIKWMTPAGRIIWLDTDARTGRVLGVVAPAVRRPTWDHGDPDRGDSDDDDRRDQRPRFEGPHLEGPGLGVPGLGIGGALLPGGQDRGGDWGRGAGGERGYDRGRGDRDDPRNSPRNDH